MDKPKEASPPYQTYGRHDTPYLHNFQTHIPHAMEHSEQANQLLHSFGNQGCEPFGYNNSFVGGNIRVPYVSDHQSQHEYRLKITAKPVATQAQNGKLPYVVTSANPTMPNSPPQVYVAQQNSESITHVVPCQTEKQGFHIKPLYPVTARHPPYAYVPQEQSPQPWATPGETEDETHGGLERRKQWGESPDDENSQTDKQVISRPLTTDKKVLQDLNLEKHKIYNWISRSTVQPTPQEEEQAKGGVEEKEPLESMETEAFAKVFSQASNKIDTRLSVKQPKDTLDESLTPHVISTPLDDELGIPNELRPSVIYAGIEHGPVEYMGTKEPLGYRLHAVEIHQYVPIPGKEDPWIIKNNVDPSNQAIFGPMPLPFNPAHSGMVAPTFQTTRNGQPIPVLCPELSRMFNEEIRAVDSKQHDSNLLSTVDQLT